MKELEEQLKELDEKYEEEKSYSFNHIMELYLFQYYHKESNFKLSEEPMNRWYVELGSKFEENEEWDKALEAYDKAICWNPVDLDARFAKIEIEKKQGNLEKVKIQTLELYPYLCSRATIARFYRNLAFYYVESYVPELAIALYEYSILFFHTENASNELEYLKEALQKKIPQYDVHQLQTIISQQKIPVSAPSQTLGLIYEVGRNQESKGNMKEAVECYFMVYDLTQDEEVKNRLERLSL